MKADDFERAIQTVRTRYLELRVKMPGEAATDRYLLQVRRVGPHDEESFFGESGGSGHFLALRLTNATLLYEVFLFKETLE